MQKLPDKALSVNPAMMEISSKPTVAGNLATPVDIPGPSNPFPETNFKFTNTSNQVDDTESSDVAPLVKINANLKPYPPSTSLPVPDLVPGHLLNPLDKCVAFLPSLPESFANIHITPTPLNGDTHGGEAVDMNNLMVPAMNNHVVPTHSDTLINVGQCNINTSFKDSKDKMVQKFWDVSDPETEVFEEWEVPSL